MDATRMIKQQKNRDNENSTPPEEQEEVEEFTGISGDHVAGTYHDLVHSWKTLSWQSNDAEVALLQDVSHYLQKRLSARYGQVTLYIRGSKGPCTSCRKVINIFRQTFPNVKVICEYQQKSAQEHDVASKAPGQDPLSYGYADAVALFPGEKQQNKESYYKVLPALVHGIQVPQGLKGFSMATLEGFFTRYVEQYALDPRFVQQFVQRQHPAVLPSEQAQSVGTWLQNRLAYEEQVALSEHELVQLLSLDSPSSGSDVTVHGLLCMVRVAPLPGWQKKGGRQRPEQFSASAPVEREERKEQEKQEDLDEQDEEHNEASQTTTAHAADPVRSGRSKKEKQTVTMLEFEGSKKLRRRVTRTLPGRGVVIDVSGDGMNCLIRALLVATGHKDDEETVGILRDELVRAQVSQTGTMLNLASTAGAILVSYMEFAGFIKADKTLVVYTPGPDENIVEHKIYRGKDEKDPLMLWLSDEHFQAIVPGKKA
jgi:hypothetical protein